MWYNQLFSFDIDVVLFHLFIGFIIYLNVLVLGISYLRFFKEDLNPVLIYPSGLFIFCLLSLISWKLDINLLIFFSISIFLLLINLKFVLKYYHNIFDTIFLFVLVSFLAIINSTTLHDPDSQNNIHAFGDTYFYIAGIYSDLSFYQFKDLTIYGLNHDLKQQAGVLLAYPFKNFDHFRPILNFSISLWILSLMFVADVIRKNIKIYFVSFQTLFFTALIYFSFRTNFYLDESLPTILTMPLIFLLSFFLFENFKKEKIIFEIFLIIITIILCLLTKQVLLLVALPIILFRGIMSKEKKIIISYFIIISITTGALFLAYQEHMSFILKQLKLTIPELFSAPNALGLHVLNRSVQFLSLILIILLIHKNIKLLIFTIYSFSLYLCISAGGPFFFWLMLFIIYSIQKYKKSNFLNFKVNNNFLIYILFFTFIIIYYFFQTYHIKIATYFLFFLFLFSSFNISQLSNKLKILIIIFAIFFPLSFSKKIPSIVNFIMKTPLDGEINLLPLSKSVEKLVPKNSIIFTDIGLQNDFKGVNKFSFFIESTNSSINYLTISKRQFYILSNYFFYNKLAHIEEFYKMSKQNQNIIYEDGNPRVIINNNYFKNYFILIKKENLNKISRLKKNINIIDDNFALIEITDN